MPEHGPVGADIEVEAPGIAPIRPGLHDQRAGWRHGRMRADGRGLGIGEQRMRVGADDHGHAR